MTTKRSYRMLQIGGTPAGLIGLDELFITVYNSGVCPDDPALPDVLLDGIRAENFVPKPAVADYQDALIEAYSCFYVRQSGESAYEVRNYGTWRGYPREHIAWFPAVAGELCNGCDRCLAFCSYGVYQKQTDGKMAVIEPFLCLVGCSSCAAVCEPKAILFPPYEMLKNYRPIG